MPAFKDLELLPVPDPVAAAVADLVDRYHRHRDLYRGSDYNEARLRQEFLNPFFAALGWDMDNRQGFAEPYKEVVHEDTLRVGDTARAPDYCFRLMGQPKFYVEAKAPRTNIRDDLSPAYQLRRYGWSAKLPLSVLTDFEEFAIYDCREKPAPTDPPAHARVGYVTYDQYADRLAEIYSIFSHDAIPKGFFDRYAEAGRGRRGTTTVDAAFLAEIERWRDDLARNLALRNDISVADLNFAVQAIIDRLLFLRIAEDRGLEPENRLQSTAAAGRNIYPALCGMFHEADHKYNSGLFDFAGDQFTTDLQVDDRVLRDIISNLYYPRSPYEFSVIGADILGAVYEQFLGKVIRLTKGGHAKVEEKPEVKKAGGVYYTPRYIVDYIVEHTVGVAL
ncbi:MAG: restriction endonuclease subunit M, partial [Armatimonadetes bacterium]|nr:restriction endonuclease subunit M [Armatimonadota bacterium]